MLTSMVTNRGVVAEIIKDLCTDIIIGRDIQGERRPAVLNFNGTKEDLVIGAMSNVTVSQPTTSSSSATRSKPKALKTAPVSFGAMRVTPPPLFTHLSDY